MHVGYSPSKHIYARIASRVWILFLAVLFGRVAAAADGVSGSGIRS
jgi:hypothetical protein